MRCDDIHPFLGQDVFGLVKGKPGASRGRKAAGPGFVRMAALPSTAMGFGVLPQYAHSQDSIPGVGLCVRNLSNGPFASA